MTGAEGLTDWRIVGGDPAPGDAEAVGVAAAVFEGVAVRSAEASRALSGLVAEVDSGTMWIGSAAIAWADQAREIPKDLESLHRSYSEAGTALRAYAATLTIYQGFARRTLAEAVAADEAHGRAAAEVTSCESERETAIDSLRSAERDVDDARRRGSDALLTGDAGLGDLVAVQLSEASASVERARIRIERLDERIREGRRRMSAAAAELDDARRRSAAIKATVEEAGDTAQGALVRASEHGIRNRHTVIRVIQDGMAFAADTARYAFTVENITSALDLVSDVMGTAAFVTAFIPGLQPLAAALGAGAVIFSAAALVGHVLRARSGDGTWTEVGLRAAMVGLSAVGAVKGVKGVLAGQQQLVRMASSGKTVTSATRPMALRTTTEQFLAHVKRVGHSDARRWTGFMNKQVGVAADSTLKSAGKLITMSVDVVRGVHSGGEVIASVASVGTDGGLAISPAPTAMEVVAKAAKVVVGAAGR